MSLEEERQNSINTLQEQLLSEVLGVDEKNNIYEQLKYLNNLMNLFEVKQDQNFRKDVIIARIVFAVLCIAIGVLIWFGINMLTNSFGDGAPQQSETQQETTTEMPTVEETEKEVLHHKKRHNNPKVCKRFYTNKEYKSTHNKSCKTI